MFEGMGPWTYELLCDGRMVPVTFALEGKRFFLSYRFNKKMNELIKSCFDYKWHGAPIGPRNQWSIANNARTRFQVQYLAHPRRDDPWNPYFVYDRPAPENNIHLDGRPSYSHQKAMRDHILHKHYCVVAGEMGVGKTWAAIQAIEYAYKHTRTTSSEVVWVAPRAALASVRLEFQKWNSLVTPIFVTYEGLEKLLENWPAGKPAPFFLVGDEISRCKNPKAQRTQRMQHLADEVRDEHGNDGYVVLMSGTPSPKMPTDWWSICEIARPGFLREGSMKAMQRRLAILERNDLVEGTGTFDKIVAWKDDESKCDICGLSENDVTHENDPIMAACVQTAACHTFKPSKNEVAHLHKRMTGLSIFVLKKDCLDLPDKVYDIIRCKPSRAILNAASAITAKSTSTVAAMTLLRELSDGFQYTKIPNGTQPCSNCKGTGLEREYVPVTDEAGNPVFDEDGNPQMLDANEMVECGHCGGSREETRYDVQTVQLPCPKEDALKSLLEEYEDVGRVVIYGGFTGTIDRITSICGPQQWEIIRVDGRGWHTTIPGLKRDTDMISAFQSKDPRKIAFVGHPGSAGMGLTLTASPVIIYYSNDFNAESRIQSEDRIHRAGMDSARGARIIDLIHLPSDEQVLHNLKAKRRLQAITMGDIQKTLEKEDGV